MTKFERNWQSWSHFLRREVPLSKKVLVRRISRPTVLKSEDSVDEKAAKEQHLGSACIKNNKFLISVSARESNLSQLDTLLHEWAHCLAQPAQHRVKTDWTHDSLFGIAYAQVYRQFFQEPEL